MSDSPQEQVVELHIPLTGEFGTQEEIDKWMAAEERLEEEMDEALGFCDGNDIGMGEYTYFFFGPSADDIVTWARGWFADQDLPEMSHFIVRRDADDEEDEGEKVPF